MNIGADYSDESCEFVVWSPNLDNVSLHFPAENHSQRMQRMKDGYWHVRVDGVKPGTSYFYHLNGKKSRPDPASNSQPEGVFGPSAVVDHSRFTWKDQEWKGTELKDAAIYEIHIGTFSQEGTFAAAKNRAKRLADLGITAVELMPVAQFSGDRNWGYDAVFPFAVQNTYGGPNELKIFVQEFHLHGIAVILDVVYNHIGPEGNFLTDFGPYFLPDRETPWGTAVNFDGPLCDQVRNFFLENAVYWFQKYHIDGLRLDAVYAITDRSSKHFLKELSEAVAKFRNQKEILLIAENDRVEKKIIQSRKKGGYELDALWHDNLHHSLHARLTGERNWYYQRFGSVRRIVEALQRNYICNERVISEDQSEICSRISFDPSKLVVFSQNHDQIGNRPKGDRLTTLAGLEAAKVAATIVILSQNTPLLFMGEEYGEISPFLFFTNYSDKTLGRKILIGRKKEFNQNGWKAETVDPQQVSTFTCSKIKWQRQFQGKNKKILGYYRNLIGLRKSLFKNQPNKGVVSEHFKCEGESILFIKKQMLSSTAAFVVNFSKESQQYRFPWPGVFTKVLDSADTAWGGPGSKLPNTANLAEEHSICPLSIAIYVK